MELLFDGYEMVWHRTTLRLIVTQYKNRDLYFVRKIHGGYGTLGDNEGAEEMRRHTIAAKEMNSRRIGTQLGSELAVAGGETLRAVAKEGPCEC